VGSKAVLRAAFRCSVHQFTQKCGIPNVLNNDQAELGKQQQAVEQGRGTEITALSYTLILMKRLC
jgi:hypothetical protein